MLHKTEEIIRKGTDTARYCWYVYVMLVKFNTQITEAEKTSTTDEKERHTCKITRASTNTWN